MDFRGDLLSIFGEDLREYSRACDLYRALCNTNWYYEDQKFSYSWRAAGELVADMRNSLDLPPGDPEVCERCHQRAEEHSLEEFEISFPFSSDTVRGEKRVCPSGETFLPGREGREDYLDFYCAGEEGVIRPWIEERMQSAGYRSEKMSPPPSD